MRVASAVGREDGDDRNDDRHRSRRPSGRRGRRPSGRARHPGGRRGAREVVLLVGPRGRAAGELLPGVSRVVEWRTPWIDPEPLPMTGPYALRLLRILRETAPEQALILTSFQQSPLPLALLLKLAGTPRTAAICADYAARCWICGTSSTRRWTCRRPSACSGWPKRRDSICRRGTPGRSPYGVRCPRSVISPGRPATWSCIPESRPRPGRGR
ncbi:hypothetical protein ACFQX6_25655 [Streptosporangium lutulentum]